MLGKRYEVYILNRINKENDNLKLRFETNDIDEACDKAHEIEKTSEEQFDATAIYDDIDKKWFGYHERGTSYIMSK